MRMLNFVLFLFLFILGPGAGSPSSISSPLFEEEVRATNPKVVHYQGRVYYKNNNNYYHIFDNNNNNIFDNHNNNNNIFDNNNNNNFDNNNNDDENNNNNNDDCVIYDWPCVQVLVSFWGNKLQVVMDGGQNFFEIVSFSFSSSSSSFKNEKKEPKVSVLKTTKGNNTYTLLEEEEPALFSLSLIKRTEASLPVMPFFPVNLYSFIASSPSLPPSPFSLSSSPSSPLLFFPPNNFSPKETNSNLKEKRSLFLEFFGDSDTNGFGDLGPNTSCTFQPQFESCPSGYTKHLSLSLPVKKTHIEAFSGKGVVQNAGYYGDTMPSYWNKTIATWKIGNNETSSFNFWDFGDVFPDGLVVYLGSNDYSNPVPPRSNKFVNGYIDMLNMFRETYPNGQQTKIISICGGSFSADQLPCPHVQEAVNTFNETDKFTYYIEIPSDLLTYPSDFGCLDHRNVKGQKKLADFLLPYFESILL